MARAKKRKRSHGTPKANHQKAAPKRKQDRKQRHMDDPRQLAKSVSEPVAPPIPSALRPEGQETLTDLFGSVYNMMHATREV